jgi:hypothetical protein
LRNAHSNLTSETLPSTISIRYSASRSVATDWTTNHFFDLCTMIVKISEVFATGDISCF